MTEKSKPGEVSLIGEPEFVGRMPIRSDIEVLPADNPNQKSIGWTVLNEYSGCEIYQIIDDLPNEEPIKEKDALSEGMKVSAWDMIWTVRFDSKSPYLDRSGTIGTLEFNIDNRECWVCSCLINKRCISQPKKISIVK